MNLWTRRDVLAFGATAAAAVNLRTTPGAGGNAERGESAVNAVDHLLLGVADLDAGIAWVEQRTGVRADVGGSHPGMGTRNALLALGGRRYLEIIAPDPAQTAYSFHIDVRGLSEPRLITWAAATRDIDGVAAEARAANLKVYGPNAGSRVRPDGLTLRWRSMAIVAAFGAPAVDPVPFFIEWAADSRHPSQDSPQGCGLESLVLHHPKAEDQTALLKGLGIEAEVRAGAEVRLTAALRTPRGGQVLQ